MQRGIHKRRVSNEMQKDCNSDDVSPGTHCCDRQIRVVRLAGLTFRRKDNSAPPEMINRSIFYKIVTNDEIVKFNWMDIATRLLRSIPTFFLDYTSF